MKISKKYLRQLIVEQYAAIAYQKPSPMRSRVDPEFARLIKGRITEQPEVGGEVETEVESEVELDRPPEGLGSFLGAEDSAVAVEGLTEELVNLLNKTGYVDLHIYDVVDAVVTALSPPYSAGNYSNQEIAKALEKSVYQLDRGDRDW